jgi:putative transposase
MGRHANVFVEGCSVHVIQKGLNGLTVFRRDADLEVFLSTVRLASMENDVPVHGFVCMNTHYHLIVSPPAGGRLPRMMKQLDGRYARYFNRTYPRTGTVWNGRYRRFLIDQERYWLTCLRYIEQNPVKAGIVSSVEGYRWSSYSAHAFGNGPEWLTYHPVYQALGSTPERRRAAYRGLCGTPLTESESVLVEESLSSALDRSPRISTVAATRVEAIAAVG